MARGGVSTEFQVSFVFSLVVVETHKHINIYDIRAIIGTTLPQMHLKNREGKKNHFLDIPKHIPFSKGFLYLELPATNRISGKNLWALIFGPKVDKVGYFLQFFSIF